MVWDEIIEHRVQSVTWSKVPADVVERAAVICAHNIALRARGACQSWASSLVPDVRSGHGWRSAGLLQ
ncbi:MAG: hypothetical protein K6T83_18435, partial [Alicyclobacillus sp.]|nr:hypothetical protein [Alicyclobacillus sp.]